MNKVKSIISIVLIILSVIFLLQNMVTVKIDFLVWTLELPRALLVVILIGIGFVIGLIASSYSKHDKRPKPPADNS